MKFFEFVGYVVVYGALTVSLLIFIAHIFVIAWVWFWGKVINLAWRGYDLLEGDKPPLWRRKVAIIAVGLQDFKRPSDVHENIREVHELNE